MNDSSSAHQFALFFEASQTFQVGQTVTLEDAQLVSRITTILRLRRKETVILFTRNTAYTVQLDDIKKRSIICIVLEEKLFSVQEPFLDIVIPLLEKNALEEVIYAATVCGVRTIYPVLTQKTKRSQLSPAELQRFQRIMIAAAEQSKQYMLPLVAQIQPLGQWLEHYAAETTVIVGDATGSSSYDVISRLKKTTNKSVTFMVGPEGDFSPEEKSFLEKYTLERCALTPAILRAEDAVWVGLGIVRSCL